MNTYASSMPVPVADPIPFHEGHLDVGHGHAIYFAEYGQTDAPATVVLHGGPGSASNPSMLDWFDLSSQRVVLFDQRGCGKSLPAGEIGHNETEYLIRDIEQLRSALDISRWLVVAGSWGTVLGVAYAGRYPQALRGLVLRGVFLASPREMTWFFQSLRALVPQAWMELTGGWSVSQQANVLQSLTRLLHNGTLAEQEEAACRWGQYEDAIMRAMTGAPAAAATPVNAGRRQKFKIQSHYLAHGCFVTERMLFRCARLTAQIRILIIHGTHDWVCPPQNVLRLQRFMPQAEVRWQAKGTHAASDPVIRDALRLAIRDMQISS